MTGSAPSAFDIAASGMAAQRIQMDVIAQNLANADVERADGVPFQARMAIFEPADQTSPLTSDAVIASDPAYGGFSAGPELIVGDDETPAGVQLAGIVEEPAALRYVFDPSNPSAAQAGPHAGYVQTGGVDPITQMIDLVATGRAYDANVSALQAAKQMDLEASDIANL